MKPHEELKKIEQAKEDHPELSEALDLLASLVEITSETEAGFNAKKIKKPDADQIKEGFPLTDKRSLSSAIGPLRDRFQKIIEIICKNDEGEAQDILNYFADKKAFTRLIEGVVIGEYTFPGDYTSSQPIALFAAGEALRLIFSTIIEMVSPEEVSSWQASYCPICGAPPHFSLIEGDENRLMVSCSRCFFIWDHLRVTCPFCGEQDQQKLRYFEAEDDPIHRVYVCDTCKHYIKNADKREKPDVLPQLEDLITLKLDIIARREGYVRDTVDLVGLLLLEDEKKK
jgi:FdhE protein